MVTYKHASKFPRNPGDSQEHPLVPINEKKEPYSTYLEEGGKSTENIADIKLTEDGSSNINDLLWRPGNSELEYYATMFEPRGCEKIFLEASYMSGSSQKPILNFTFGPKTTKAFELSHQEILEELKTIIVFRDNKGNRFLDPWAKSNMPETAQKYINGLGPKEFNYLCSELADFCTTCLMVNNHANLYTHYHLSEYFGYEQIGQLLANGIPFFSNKINITIEFSRDTIEPFIKSQNMPISNIGDKITVTAGNFSEINAIKDLISEEYDLEPHLLRNMVDVTFSRESEDFITFEARSVDIVLAINLYLNNLGKVLEDFDSEKYNDSKQHQT